MIIYRVQKNGVGPFMSNNRMMCVYPHDLEYYDSYLLDGSERNQQPSDDMGTELQHFSHAKRGIFGDYIFGVSSKQDLFTWFSPVKMGYLYAHGFSVWVYDVPDALVVKGSRQVCFRCADAQSCKSVNLHTLRRYIM